MSAPTRTGWGPSTCGCGCRSPKACADGCGCAECQPGPGIDFGARHGRRTVLRNQRLGELLRKDHLTPEEQDEMDDLLHWYIHR